MTQFKRMITTIVGGSSKSLEEIGLVSKKIKLLWTVYDEEKMWESNQFNPYTGKRIVRGEQDSLEGLVLLHEHGVLVEDYAHDWSVKSDGRLHYYSRYVPMGRETKILIEYEG